MRLLLALAALAATMMSLGGLPGIDAQPGSTPWPMFQGGPTHSGLSPYTGPQGNGLRCTAEFDAQMAGMPVIAQDDTIYLPTGNAEDGTEGKGRLQAINSDCTLKWAYELPGGPALTAPAIAADGTIYVHVNGKEGNTVAVERLVALHPDGTHRWTFDFNDGAGMFTSSRQSSPAIAPDGTIWVGSMNTFLHALNPDGTLKCAVSFTMSSISGSPALGPDGAVYVSDSFNLTAVRPSDCSILWSHGRNISGNDASPVIGGDGTIYFPGAQNADGQVSHFLYAYNPDGTIQWRFSLGTGTDSTPALGADGTIYVAADGLYAVNPDGTQKWRHSGCWSATGSSSSAPVVGADGTVYWMQSFRHCAQGPDGASKWMRPVDPAPPFFGYSGAIGPDGALYFPAGPGPGGKTVKLHVYFDSDTAPPVNPTLQSPSHAIQSWSTDNTVEITWSGASDAMSGVGGFSYLWDVAPSTVPPATKNAEATATSATSPPLADGNAHYFHLRTVDDAGNWADPVHVGPFWIDTTPPGNPALSSPSHVTGTPSDDPTVDVVFPGASDATSGVDGYSFLWDTSPSTVPDTTKDAEETTTGGTSPPFADGDAHYFHLRTRDNAGLWSEAVHLGPFPIQGTAPEDSTALESDEEGSTSADEEASEQESAEQESTEQEASETEPSEQTEDSTALESHAHEDLDSSPQEGSDAGDPDDESAREEDPSDESPTDESAGHENPGDAGPGEEAASTPCPGGRGQGDTGASTGSEIRVHIETRNVREGHAVLRVLQDGVETFRDSFCLPDDGVSERSVRIPGPGIYELNLNATGGPVPGTGVGSWTRDTTTTADTTQCPSGSRLVVTWPLDPRPQSPYSYFPPKLPTSSCSAPSDDTAEPQNAFCDAYSPPFINTLEPAPGETVTDKARPRLTATYNAHGKITLAQLELDGVNVTGAASFGPTSMSYEPAWDLSSGERSATLKLKNCAGSTEKSWIFIVAGPAMDRASPGTGESMTASASDAPPTAVSITGIEDGASVQGEVSVTIAGRSEEGLTSIELHLDSALIGRKEFDGKRKTGVFAFVIETRNLTRGAHDITAVATAASGQRAESVVTIRITNWHPPPEAIPPPRPAEAAREAPGPGLALVIPAIVAVGAASQNCRRKPTAQGRR